MKSSVLGSRKIASVLGPHIASSREVKGINQRELALAIGCTPQFLGRFEKGKIMLPEHLLIKCIGLLDLRPANLKKMYIDHFKKGIDLLFEKAGKPAFKEKPLKAA